MAYPSSTLLIEGWREIPHSYAIVNQFQCLEMLKMPGIQLLHRDVPYYGSTWRPITGLFPPETEAAIRSIPGGGGDVEVDALLRIAYPYNCAPSEYKRTCVFGTAEFRCVSNDSIAQRRPLRPLMSEGDFTVLTPSNWSRDGFIASGADPDRVVVIPHGVDPAIYHPIPDNQRIALRAQTDTKGFTFLNVGSMTGNKGLRLLLKAFAAVAGKHSHVRLVMKGLDALYPSHELLQQRCRELAPAEANLVQQRLTYMGQTLSFADMAKLYQACDAYVSPYQAEGFNMPVLEAAACGMVVICTAGGSTDDFTHEDFALRIASTPLPVKQSPGMRLLPSYDHLVHQMMTAVESPDFCAKAREAGPAFAHNGFTWQQVTEKLVSVILPDRESC